MDLTCLETCVNSNFNDDRCRSCEATRPILVISGGPRGDQSLDVFLESEANERLSGITYIIRIKTIENYKSK